MPPITKILFEDGATLEPGQLTVAIGPNNGGKSRFLRELVNLVTQNSAVRLAVREADVDKKIILETTDALMKLGEDENGRAIFDGLIPDLSVADQQRPDAEGVRNQIRGDRAETLLHLVGRHLLAHLTTERRLQLVKRQLNRSESIQGAQSPLHAAFRADAATIEQSEILLCEPAELHLISDVIRAPLV